MLKIFIYCFFSFSCFCNCYFVGIAGGSGSGKTTFSNKIHEAFPYAIIISQDAYYKDLSSLPLEKRGKVNFDHPQSLDFDLLKEHMLALKNGQSVKLPIYDFKTHTRSQTTSPIEPSRIIIIEGILLFAVPEIRELFDLKIFIDTDDDIRLLRRIERDIKERGFDFNSVKEQYLETVKPMYEAFVEPSKKYADLIVPGVGYNTVAIEVILTKLNELLK